MTGAASGFAEHLAAEMRAAGIEAPPLTFVADGAIHRFASTPGHGAAGWYVVHDDPAGPLWFFGDWRLGIRRKGNGDASGGHSLTPEEIEERSQRLRDLQFKIAAENARFQAGAAIEARERWDRANPASAHHPYLKSKGVEPFGLQQEGDNILVAMRDIDGKIWSVQEIGPTGWKHNQEGARRKGCFFQIGEFGDTFCIGEGFATCATLHMATGYAVASTGDAGNLEPVARALRKKYPDATIIICGDDDWLTRVNGKPHNTGKIAAQKVAKAIDGVLVLPWFGPARPQWATDFNDVAKLSGPGEVATGIRLALIEHEERAREAPPEEPPPAAPEDFDMAPDNRSSDDGVSLDDFHAYMPAHTYIFAPTREMWPPSSVNARINPIPLLDARGQPLVDKEGKQRTMAAHAWLDRHKPVEQMTWAPGMPELIRGRLISDGGWIERDGVTTFNMYRAPRRQDGDPAAAGMWTDHIYRVFGEDATHIIYWLAHRVQRPHEKINHALVLGGNQGVGKDTLLEPVKYAIGPWNFSEVSPQHLLGSFNGFLKSVILRVSEARDLGDVDRFKFYDHSKAFTAAPPDVLRVNEKHLREHYVLNVTGVIITSNHKTDGIFLPADDRRHFVAWSELSRDDFGPSYWNDIWRWYQSGGYGHVGAYLAAIDLASFDPKAPPPKTDAFWSIVDASRAPEDAELADVLDRLGNPDVVTIARIVSEAPADFVSWLVDKKNRKTIGHRMDDCDYVPVRNRDAKDGLWRLNGKRQAIYAKRGLSERDRLHAVTQLTADQWCQ